MNASKEEATKAINCFRAVYAAIGEQQQRFHGARLLQISGFLEAAHKKLPTEAAYAKDKRRKVVAK